MIYKLQKISEAPTDIDPHDEVAIKREARNWYLAVDEDGNQYGITNPLTWKTEERKPGVWYRVRPKALSVGEALEVMRANYRKQD